MMWNNGFVSSVCSCHAHHPGACDVSGGHCTGRVPGDGDSGH